MTVPPDPHGTSAPVMCAARLAVTLDKQDCGGPGRATTYSPSRLSFISPRSFVSPALTVTPLARSPAGSRMFIPLKTATRYVSPGGNPSIRNVPSLSARRPAGRHVALRGDGPAHADLRPRDQLQVRKWLAIGRHEPSGQRARGLEFDLHWAVFIAADHQRPGELLLRL